MEKQLIEGHRRMDAVRATLSRENEVYDAVLAASCELIYGSECYEKHRKEIEEYTGFENTEAGVVAETGYTSEFWGDLLAGLLLHVPDMTVVAIDSEKWHKRHGERVISQVLRGTEKHVDTLKYLSRTKYEFEVDGNARRVQSIYDRRGSKPFLLIIEDVDHLNDDVVKRNIIPTLQTDVRHCVVLLDTEGFWENNDKKEKPVFGLKRVYERILRTLIK